MVTSEGYSVDFGSRNLRSGMQYHANLRNRLRWPKDTWETKVLAATLRDETCHFPPSNQHISVEFGSGSRILVQTRGVVPHSCKVSPARSQKQMQLW
jgi:hypothetical protein